jgi:NADH:ubiquinone oxidoreductase subunit 6 (subunit J)
MDSLHTIGFYVSAALAVIGGLLVAFLSNRLRRAGALAVAGLGVAGIYLSLSAGVAALAALVCFGGSALLLARRDYRTIEAAVSSRWRQAGAVGAAALFAILAYSAFRGSFAHSVSMDGTPVGALLFTHDAPATLAVGGLVLVGLVGATAAWRARDRGRGA